MKLYAKEGIVPLWACPEAGAERTDEALAGTELTPLEEAGGFCRVRTFYGYEGWAEKSLLCAAADGWERAEKRLVVQPWADVLAGAKVQAPVLRSLPRGAEVGLLEEAEGWHRVLLCDGTVGWLPGQFLAAPPPPWRERPEEQVRRSLVEAARSYLGVQYRWGGKTPLGIDCSGLCSMAYLLNGIVIWRDAKLHPGYCLRPVPAEETRAGDLLFFPGHVVMRLEGDRYLHATCGGGAHGVVVNSFRRGAPDYRADLTLDGAEGGSIFSGGDGAFS